VVSAPSKKLVAWRYARLPGKSGANPGVQAGFIVNGLPIDLYGNGLKLLVCMTGAGFVGLDMTFFRGIPTLGSTE
jgi:hypothetical protein